VGGRSTTGGGGGGSDIGTRRRPQLTRIIFLSVILLLNHSLSPKIEKKYIKISKRKLRLGWEVEVKVSK
jgi:hypothetical protein